jgi:glycosyltransferase involved in cell wall biosynthesis
LRFNPILTSAPDRGIPSSHGETPVNEVTVRPDVSVIVSAYQSRDTLRLVLLGLRRQTVLPHEVLVADDGSEPSMERVAREACAGAPFEAYHVWQPDAGFRAARSRNNAIHRARGEILAFLDQDTIPHRTWLATHLGSAGPRRVCLARIVPLTETESAGLAPEAVSTGEFERRTNTSALDSLKRQQAKYRFYALLRLLRLPIKTTRPSLSSGNMCAWRDDLKNVNGFDEAYVGWGQEDDDLGRHLYMSGVKPVPLLTTAMVSHVWHPTRHSSWRTGPNIRRYRTRLKSPRCANGLDAHPHPDVVITRVA